MGKERNFEERMSKLSDEELYDVLANEKDYVPEAIAAAKSVFHSRGLSSETLAEIKTEIETIAEEEEKEKEEKAKVPLPLELKILSFVFAVGIPQAIAAELFRKRGYVRQANEIWKWMGYGLIFYIVITILKSL